MSESNKKRCRKDKLVPRTFKDGEVPNNMQDEPKRKLLKLHNKIKTEENEPSTSTYRPPQFNIKVEVEECDADEVIEPTADLALQRDIKTEVFNDNDLFEAEELDINKLLAQALTTTQKSFLESSDDETACNTKALNNDHDYSPRDVSQVEKPKLPRKRVSKPTQSSTTVTHLQIKEQLILDSLDDLLKGNLTLADQVLAIEMRNLWGRLMMTEWEPTGQDIKVQLALNTFRFRKLPKEAEVPLMYKCYICDLGWWHLDPFQDHLRIHEEKELRVETESLGFEYSIIAFSSNTNHFYRPVKLDSHCWRCGYAAEIHEIRIEELYKCQQCLKCFDKCIDLKAHETECLISLKKLVRNGPVAIFTCNICDLKTLQKDSLAQHYLEYHDVRSDLPMFVDVRTCSTCSRNYVSLPFHYCTKKNYSIMCNTCNKRFPTKVALEVHLEEKSGYKCPVCSEMLPRRCMVMEHMLKHTDKFTMLYKCLSCKDNMLLFDVSSTRRHKIIWHKQRIDKRRNFFEKVLAPKSFIDAQKTEEMDIAGGVKRPASESEGINASLTTEGKIDNSVSAVEVEIDVNSADSDDDVIEIVNTPETIDLVDDEPSTSANIKRERPDTDVLTEQTVKERMIKEMEKNNSFADDESGYEYILSSVFNASNSSILDDEMAGAADDFEELINQELNKSKTKNICPKPPTMEHQDNNKRKVLLEMVSKMETVDPNRLSAVSKKYMCDFEGCVHLATDKQSLKIHKSSHKVIACSRCDKEFYKVKDYVYHLPVHGFSRWNCPDCSKSFPTSTTLAAHMRVKAQKQFTKVQYLDKSVRKQKLYIKYQCRKCKLLVRKRDILCHWETHIGVQDPKVKVEIEEREGEVAVGTAKDEQGESVKEEQESVEKAQWKWYPDDMTPDIMKTVIEALVSTDKRRKEGTKTCFACGRVFERRNDCKRHHIEHLLTNAYSTKQLYKGLRCQICHMLFESAHTYKHHMRNHGHLPLYECKVCYKTFSDSSNHVKHKKTHSSMYVCDICSKKFQAKTSLIKHMECHRTVVKINCMFCPRVFYTESAFTRHVRSSHNQNEYKFSCMICKKKFKSVKDKSDHMWIMHEERRVKADCPVCSAEFRKIRDVKNHIKSVHDMEMSSANLKLFRQFLEKMKAGKDVDEVLRPALTVKGKREDMTYFVVEDAKGGPKSIHFATDSD